MIIGEYAACGTCGKNYRLRVQVGLDKIQNHNFHCLQCQEPIYVKLVIGGGDNSGIIFGENCLPGTAEDATPQYLSSDFFAGADEVNAPKSMPSLNFMMDVIKKIGVNKLNEITNRKGNPLTSYQKRPEEIWPTLKKAWRMKRSGQNKLSESMIKKFSKENGCDPDLESSIFFLLDQITPNTENLIAEFEKIKNHHPEEFLELNKYIKHSLHKIHMLDYFSIISEYFEHFSEFSKTYLYSHFETNLPDQATTSSGDFEKVKKFYATCYEFYASAIIIFTCANNIKSNRKYNQLKNIDFKKYLESDKSKRKENFKENEIFSNFSIEFDSTIRNASFHNWIRLNDDHTTIEFRSGGTGELQSMTYAEYLNKCSKLFFQICQLFKIELALTSN